MAAQPPQALEPPSPKAWLVQTVRRRSRQLCEAAAMMAVVLPRMLRPRAAWGAGRPRQSFGVLSSAQALKTVVFSSSAQQLFGDVHMACIGSGFGRSCRSMCCRESTRRALQSSALFVIFVPRALGVCGRRAWAPDLMYPYGSHMLLVGDSGLSWWVWAAISGDLLLGTVGRGPGLVGSVVGTAREGPKGRYIGGAR
jgi:hypothetical protein